MSIESLIPTMLISLIQMANLKHTIDSIPASVSHQPAEVVSLPAGGGGQSVQYTPSADRCQLNG